MGTNNLATIGASIVRAVGTQLDQYFTAITGVFVPRNSAGVPETGTQDLGSTTYKWRNGHLDEINVDNIKIDGNTISSTDTDGDINITPDGAGEVVIGGNVPNIDCTQINISNTLTLKSAIVTSAQFDINSSGTYDYTIAHGKGAKLRGAFPPFWTSTGGSGMSGVTSLTLMSISETVLNIRVIAVGNIDPATVSCVIFYID
jgi:hypothetical protein